MTYVTCIVESRPTSEARPVVRVRGADGGRVSIAGVACYRPGDRSHLTVAWPPLA